MPVGLAAIIFPALYVISDLMELANGGLFTAQLIVTYLAEASIPFFILGLNAVQQTARGLGEPVRGVVYGVSPSSASRPPCSTRW